MSLVDLGKRLLESAKMGDTDDVKTLMANGAPFTTDWLGTSPLHFACRQGHINTAEVLLRAGISRDARTKVDRTPLHIAAQEGHSDIVDLLIKQGADIEAKDMLKMTPLHWAVEKGHLDVVGTLLSHGADVNCQNKFDQNAMEIATFNGRIDFIPTLQQAATGQLGMRSLSETTISTSQAQASATLAQLNRLKQSLRQGGDGTGNSSTAVLATLAALAEATAPIDTLSHNAGITYITGEDVSETSASDNHPTYTLTEAGKLALKYVKQNPNVVSTEETNVEVENENVYTIQVCPDEGDNVVEDGPLVVAMAADESEATPEFHNAMPETEPELAEPPAKRRRQDNNNAQASESEYAQTVKENEEDSHNLKVTNNEDNTSKT